VILSETTEMIGTEEVLKKRAANPEVGEKLYGMIKDHTQFVKDALGPFASMVISPGNVEGGLTNITEKSLGCIIKGGTSQVIDVIDYGAEPSARGLVIMDTPGSDLFSLTGMAAGGTQIMLFTTGRGSPVGFPIVPVVKIASSSELFNMMEDDMDVNAGRLLEGVSIGEAGDELVDLVKRVAEGEQPKAEVNQQDCLSIHTVGPAF
jgi:altronate dehydratase large subunit